MDWLESLGASVVVASHIHAEQGEPLDLADERLHGLFPMPPLVGSRVLSGGEIWTDFQVGPDGVSRRRWTPACPWRRGRTRSPTR